MDEQKFSVCSLAIDTLILKVAALNPINEKARSILKDIIMKEEDWSEKRIALELDDVLEYCVLREPDDKDSPHMEEIIKAFQKELPNYEEYKKKYNWD